MLNQLKCEKVQVCLKRLEQTNKDLEEVLDIVENTRYFYKMDSQRKNFEAFLKLGNLNIFEVEKILEEIPQEDLNKEVLNKYIEEKSLYEFRRELLIEVLKEAYKRNLPG